MIFLKATTMAAVTLLTAIHLEVGVGVPGVLQLRLEGAEALVMVDLGDRALGDLGDLALGDLGPGGWGHAALGGPRGHQGRRQGLLADAVNHLDLCKAGHGGSVRGGGAGGASRPVLSMQSCIFTLREAKGIVFTRVCVCVCVCLSVCLCVCVLAKLQPNQ